MRNLHLQIQQIFNLEEDKKALKFLWQTPMMILLGQIQLRL